MARVVDADNLPVLFRPFEEIFYESVSKAVRFQPLLCILEPELRQEDPLELVVLQHHRDGMLEKLYPFEQVVNIQSLVDNLVYLAILFCDFPVPRIETDHL